MAKKPTGAYRWRIVILGCVFAPQGPNGEEVPSWPDPTPGTNEYQAARDNFSAGETIVQGIRQSEGGMKLRIKGSRISVNAKDRVRVKTSGELFEVTGVSRDEGTFETILNLERVHQQSTAQ